MPIDTTELLKKYNVTPSSKPGLAAVNKESGRGIITNKQLKDPKQFQIEEDAEFETARRSELDKITSLLDQLEKDYSSEKTEIIKKSRENWDNTPIRGGMLGGISLPTIQRNIPVETKQYTATRNVLKRAKSTLEALTPADYRIAKLKGEDLQGFWGNFGQGFSDKPNEDYIPFYNLLSGGGSEAQVNDVLEKATKKQTLSKAEQNILNAQATLQESQKINQQGGGVTTGYSVGSGIAQTLPFMAELALGSAGVGGIGLAGSIAANAVPRMGIMLAQNAVITPFMSSASQDYNRRTGEQYTINSDEDKITVNRDNETSELERLFKAYGSSFANTTSERIFSMIPTGVISKAWNGVAPKLVGAKLAGDITKGVSKIATPNVLKWNNYAKKYLNYDGGIEEFGEEMINNVMEPLLTGEPERIADNFSKENLWVTALSTTLMSSGFHLTSAPIIIKDAIKSGKVSSKAKELFAGIEDANLKQQVFNASKASTIGEKAVKLSQIDWTGVAPADAARAFDYVNLSTQKEVLQGANYTIESQSKLQLARDQYAQLSNPETGNIEVIQSEDGNIYQILYDQPANPNDAIRYAENLETNEIEQIDVSKTNIVHSTDFNTYMQNIADSLSEKITTNAQVDIENDIREEAQEEGIDPTEAILSTRGIDLSSIEGQQVLLEDGRTVYIAGNDGNSYIGKWEDPETMEEHDVEVLPDMIMGLQSDTDTQVESPQLSQVEQSTQSNAELPVQSTPIDYPRDKTGNINYDLITDDQTYVNALKEDFSEQETLEIADKYLANIDKKIKSASRIEDPIKQLRKIKELNNQKAIWNSRKQLLSPTTKVDVPIKEITAQESQPVNLNLKGEYLSLEDYILRDIASGLKFRWADDGVKRGLATELGFKNNNSERKNRISILRNNGTTVDRYTESIMEQLGSDLPDWRIDENDVRSTIIDTVLKVFSPKQAREQALAIRNKYDQSSYEQQYVEEIIERNKDDDAQFNEYFTSAIKPLSENNNLEIFTTFIDDLDTNEYDLRNAENNTRIHTELTSGETKSATEGYYYRSNQENSQSPEYYDTRSNTDSNRTTHEQNQEIDVDPVRDATNDEEKYEAVKSIVNHLNTLSGADAVVFSSIEQLPEKVKILFTEQFEQGYQTPAITLGVKTLIYSPTIIDTLDLKEVYNHEVAAHQNILRALGNDKESERLLYAKIVDDISTDEMDNVSDTDFRDYISSYRDSNSDKDKFILGKEYVAYLTKDYFTTNDYTSDNIGELSLNLSDVLDLGQVVNLLKVVNQNDRQKRIITILPRDLEQGLHTEMRNSGSDRGRGSFNDVTNPSGGLRGDQAINPARDGLQTSEDRSVSDNQTEISERNTGRTDRDQQDVSSTTVEQNSELDNIRFRSDNDTEIEQIKVNSIDNGTFMKAPNGADSNLSKNQWLQVRTKAFKDWFGDWEKVARIEKLRNSKPVEIVGDEITPSDDIKQYRKNALEYGKTLRGEYLNKDTGEKISLTAGSKIGGVKEVLSHDYKDVEHLQSIAAVPKIIENATYIGTEANTNVTKPDIVSYDYYVCGLKIGETDYTVKAVVCQSKDGVKYYDHKLTDIEKGRLLTLLESLSMQSAESNHPIPDIKDKRLISILQTNSSKVVDANGEPMVVYHGTDAKFTEFNHSQFNRNGFFFAENKDVAESFSKGSGRIISVFLNMQKPAYKTNALLISRKTTKDNDGVVSEKSGQHGTTMYVVFNPNQIKSAFDNNGNFSTTNNDIRFRDQQGEQKALNWLTQQRSNSAEVDNPIKGDNTSANIIKKFANPTKSSFRKGDTQETTQSGPKNITETIDQLEQKFGVTAIRCENRKALPSNIRFRMSPKARYSGVYNNGQVYMILDDITDADDAIATYLHEVVSHKGIEGLLGKDKADRLYTAIFDSLDNRTQNELLDRYGNKVIAGDEYCAEIAEGNVTPSVMQRVISAIRKFFREVVGLPLRISDNDIRYILWKSARKLQKASTLGESMRAISRDQDLKLELFDPVRFRKKQEVVSKEFNILDSKSKIEQNAIKAREVLQDDKIRVKLLQDLVLKRGGKVDITKDLYSSLNRLDSVTKTAMDKFERKFINPLIEHISALTSSDGSKITYEQVSDYVNAKHSIERHDSGVNALSEEEDGNWTREVAQSIVENFEAELSSDQLNQLWDHVRKATNEILLINVNAGIMTSENAKELIKRWEYYVPLRGKDFEFENQINLAEYYDYVGGAGYGKTIQNVAGKKAKGRISKSEDPLASIQHVGFLTIMYAERNKTLMNAVRLVQSNSEMTDLFSMAEMWYRKRPDGTWEESETPPTAEEVKSSVIAKRNVTDIKKQLQDAKKNNAKSDVIEKLNKQLNDAMDEVTVNKVAYSFGKGYKGTSPSQEMQNYITVMRNGVAQRVRFTDVSIANAINEISDSVIGNFARSKFGQKVGQGTRFLASISTSKNPAFIMANYIRDVQHAYLYNLVDSNGNSNGYLKYAFTSFKPIHRYLLKQEKPLTIAEMAGYDITKIEDRVVLSEKYGHDRVQDTLYDIFISNGGKTGYLHIENAKDYSKKLERQTKRLENHSTIAEFAHGLNVGMDYMAEMSETSTRFAVFLSQLDKGKDVLTAVNYAKDITVNFNRKGKWGKGLGVLYLFYNAGIQGSFNAAKLGWKNKGQASLAIGTIAVMGYANSLLLEAILAGDDDQKWKISDYEKRTNMIIPAFWTENGYIKIPIPILIRPAWNMGLVANDYLNGKVDATEAVKSIFSTSFNSMSPVDVDTESLGKAITPTIVKPILEINTWNTDFTGRQINRDPFLASQKGYIPDSQLGQPYVNSILKNITTWLNELGGGNEFVPAGLNWDGSTNPLTEWMDISPSTLEHILVSYTGGLGKEIMRAINFVTDDEARKQARNTPILNRFYGQAYKQNPSKEYYDIKKMLENTTRLLKKSLEAQQPASGLTLDELAKKVEVKTANLKELKTVDKKIRSIREDLQDLQEGTPEFAEKRAEIENLQTKFIKYYNDNND